MMGRIQEFCVNARPNYKTYVFAENAFVLAKGYNHICSASPTKKKVTWRGRGAGVKNKIQGAGPSFGRILVDDLQRLAPQEKIASPGQPPIDRKWWDKLKNFVPTRGQIAKQAFFPEDTFVHAKGFCINVGIRGLWKTASCQPGSQVPGIHFFPYQIEGGKIWHVTNASIQEIIFLLGYQRGKFIGCWTLGTRKLAKKIQKGGWKWDFGFRG